MTIKTALVLALVAGTPLAFAADKEKDANESRSRVARAHTKERFMQQYDSDGDGKVSKEEFLAARVISHEEKDLNGDGVVTAAEYVAEWEVRLDKQLAAQREASVKQAYVRFGVLDKDEDNDMTIDEFNASGDRTFGMYDTDGDGVVSEGEAMPERRFGDVEEQTKDSGKKTKKKKS